MQSVECVSLIEGPSHIYTKIAISEDKQQPVPQGNMPVLTLEIGELYIYYITLGCHGDPIYCTLNKVLS